MSGYFAGKANDSTFLGGSDIDFGNSLLLPNEDLNPGYQKIDLSGSYVVHRSVKGYHDDREPAGPALRAGASDSRGCR